MRPPGNLPSACSAAAKVETRGLIGLNGGGGQGLRTRSKVGPDGRQALQLVSFSFVWVLSVALTRQWPEGSAVASRPASDPPLRQSTRLGRVASLGLCSFPVEIRSPNF